MTAAPSRPGLWRRWVALLDTREAANTLALVRICTGLTLSGHMLNLWRTGGVDLVWVDAAQGGLRNLNAGWLDGFGGLTPENVHAVMALTILRLSLMSAGVFTRVTTVTTWFLWGFLADLNSHAGGSYDEVLKNTLLLLAFSGSGNAMSFDSRYRGKRDLVMSWPRWLMLGQLVVIYYATAIQKVSVSWMPFGERDALWYILQQPTWQRFPITAEQLLPFYPITQIATLSVWCWEQSAPLLLLAMWFRHTRTRGGAVRSLFNRLDFRFWFLLYGVGMHIGIDTLMEVGPFSVATMTLYFAAVHPDEWRNVPGLRRLVGR